MAKGKFNKKYECSLTATAIPREEGYKALHGGHMQIVETRKTRNMQHCDGNIDVYRWHRN